MLLLLDLKYYLHKPIANLNLKFRVLISKAQVFFIILIDFCLNSSQVKLNSSESRKSTLKLNKLQICHHSHQQHTAAGLIVNPIHELSHSSVTRRSIHATRTHCECHNTNDGVGATCRLECQRTAEVTLQGFLSF